MKLYQRGLMLFCIIQCTVFPNTYTGISNIFVRAKDRLATSFKDMFHMEPMSVENEEKIRVTIKKFGMENYHIKIYKMNSYMIRQFGRNNAFVAPWLGTIFVGENFFNELSSNEQEFIIGHELMHMYYSHVIKQNACAFGTYLTSLYITHLILTQSKIKEKVFQKTGNIGLISVDIANIAMSAVLAKVVSQKLSRVFEAQADRESAKRLGGNGIKAGIGLFKKSLRLYGNNKPKNIVDKIFSSHPSNYERLKNLKKLL